MRPNCHNLLCQVGPGVGGTSLPELTLPITPERVPRNEQRPSVSARDAVALRLAFMAGVLAQVNPDANVTSLPAISLKVLVVEAQHNAVSVCSNGNM